jgi:hypothetical protein
MLMLGEVLESAKRNTRLSNMRPSTIQTRNLDNLTKPRTVYTPTSTHSLMENNSDSSDEESSYLTMINEARHLQHNPDDKSIENLSPLTSPFLSLSRRNNRDNLKVLVNKVPSPKRGLRLRSESPAMDIENTIGFSMNDFLADADYGNHELNLDNPNQRITPRSNRNSLIELSNFSHSIPTKDIPMLRINSTPTTRGLNPRQRHNPLSPVSFGRFESESLYETLSPTLSPRGSDQRKSTYSALFEATAVVASSHTSDARNR